MHHVTKDMSKTVKEMGGGLGEWIGGIWGEPTHSELLRVSKRIIKASIIEK